MHHDRYIFPPRPTTAVTREATDMFAKLGWHAQLKYNGSRCLIKIISPEVHQHDSTHLQAPSCTVSADPNAPHIQLWNRHGERFRDYRPTPELYAQLVDLAHTLDLADRGWSLLDGELIDKKHPAIKHTIAVWDVLVERGEHLLGTTYADRYARLTPHICGPYSFQPSSQTDFHGGNKNEHKVSDAYTLGDRFQPDVFLPRNYRSTEWLALWEMVYGINDVTATEVLEGLVFKSLSGVLEPGRRPTNNAHWMCRSRIANNRHRY